MRLYLNQSDIDKAISSNQDYDICSRCPIAQLFKRKFHGKISVGFISVKIDGVSKFRIKTDSKARKIVNMSPEAWHTVKPQHLNFKEIK